MMYKIVNNLPGVFLFKRTLTWGLLWWSSGLLQRLRHTALPMQGAQVRSLVQELVLHALTKSSNAATKEPTMKTEDSMHRS